MDRQARQGRRIGIKGMKVDWYFYRQEKYFSAVHARWDKDIQAGIGSANTGRSSQCPRGSDRILFSLEGYNISREITGGLIS